MRLFGVHGLGVGRGSLQCEAREVLGSQQTGTVASSAGSTCRAYCPQAWATLHSKHWLPSSMRNDTHHACLAQHVLPSLQRRTGQRGVHVGPVGGSGGKVCTWCSCPGCCRFGRCCPHGQISSVWRPRHSWPRPARHAAPASATSCLNRPWRRPLPLEPCSQTHQVPITTASTSGCCTTSRQLSVACWMPNCWAAAREDASERLHTDTSFTPGISCHRGRRARQRHCRPHCTSGLQAHRRQFAPGTSCTVYALDATRFGPVVIHGVCLIACTGGEGLIAQGRCDAPVSPEGWGCAVSWCWRQRR